MKLSTKIHSTFNRGLRGSTVEGYFFWNNRRGPAGPLSVYTMGGHAFGKLDRGFDYNVEVAMQSGHIGGSDFGAWAGYWETGYATGTAAAAPRLVLEYNYASGDDNPADDKVGTFDNLYPTDKYGTADGIAWRNIHEPNRGGGVEAGAEMEDQGLLARLLARRPP